jgi:hypothetical protein
VSAATKQQITRADPLDVFCERCAARAYLWSIGEIELSDAVDELQHSAERDGLVEHLGQDGVQLALALAFRKYREAS